MKMTFAALAFVMAFSTSAFSAEGLVYTVKVHEVLTLKKVAKTKFEKISQVATGQAKLDYVSGSGTKNMMSQDINEASEEAVSLEVTGKNIVRLIDVKENINKEIPATINTSLFGAVKKITVDAKTMQGLYAASMKKAGRDTLGGFSLFAGALRSTINSTDMNCAADGDLLICQQDQVLVMTLE